MIRIAYKKKEAHEKLLKAKNLDSLGQLCPYCDTQFQDYNGHLFQQDEVTNNTNVSCNYCDLVIPNPTCMKRHEEKVHGGLYSGISCQECNIAFYDYKNLKTHKDLCHNADVQASIERYQLESEIQNDNLDEDIISDEEASNVAEAESETSGQFHENENLTPSTSPDGDSKVSSQGLDNAVKEEKNIKRKVNKDDNGNPKLSARIENTPSQSATPSIVKFGGKPWGWVTSEGIPRSPNARICDTCKRVFNTRDNKKSVSDHFKKCQKFYRFAIDREMCGFCRKNDFLSYGRLLSHIETEHEDDIEKDYFKENINEIDGLEKSPGSSLDHDEIAENSDENNENESDQIPAGDFSPKTLENNTSTQEQDQYIMDVDGLNLTEKINVKIQDDFQEIECDFCGVPLTDLEGHDCINEKNDEENDINAEEESTNMKVRILKKGYIY